MKPSPLRTVQCQLSMSTVKVYCQAVKSVRSSRSAIRVESYAGEWCLGSKYHCRTLEQTSIPQRHLNDNSTTPQLIVPLFTSSASASSIIHHPPSSSSSITVAHSLTASPCHCRPSCPISCSHANSSAAALHSRAAA